MRFRVALLLLLALPLAAHNYPMTHGTLTIMEGGARLKLRLPTHHFHPALERFAGQRLAPKDGEAYPVELLERYFAGALDLRGPQGAILRFSVMKQELDATELMVTLEVLAPSLQDWALRNAVLMDADARQVNLVTVEGLRGRRGLTFNRKHTLLALP